MNEFPFIVRSKNSQRPRFFFRICYLRVLSSAFERCLLPSWQRRNKKARSASRHQNCVLFRFFIWQPLVTAFESFLQLILITSHTPAHLADFFITHKSETCKLRQHLWSTRWEPSFKWQHVNFNLKVILQPSSSLHELRVYNIKYNLILKRFPRRQRWWLIRSSTQ